MITREAMNMKVEAIKAALLKNKEITEIVEPLKTEAEQ